MPEIASKLSWVSHAYVPLRTARMPANASLVTLIDMLATCAAGRSGKGFEKSKSPRNYWSDNWYKMLMASMSTNKK